MSEWISVEDRLPEKQSWNHIAILDTKTGRISVEQDLYAIETAEKFKQKKGFCKDGRFNGREVVIAWMPFPEPPISKQVTSSKRKPATETCLFCGQVTEVDKVGGQASAGSGRGVSMHCVTKRNTKHR